MSALRTEDGLRDSNLADPLPQRLQVLVFKREEPGLGVELEGALQSLQRFLLIAKLAGITREIVRDIPLALELFDDAQQNFPRLGCPFQFVQSVGGLNPAKRR